MEKIILTDCDGVLVDWNTAFGVYMRDRGYTVAPRGMDNYNIGTRFNIPQSEGDKLAETFNCSEHIRYLSAYKDSITYVNKLAELGFRFVVISSFTDDKHAYQNRVINLRLLFGDAIAELHTLPIAAHGGKDAILKRWQGSGLLWIEDHMYNALTGAKLGLTPLLVDHSYNRDHTGDEYKQITRLRYDHPWEDIYTRVLKKYFRTTELP